MKNRTRRALALVGSAVALTIALSGCSVLDSLTGGGDAERDEETGQVLEEDNIDIFALKVGDCMPDSGDGGEISDADVIPCEQPHFEEVFHEFKMAEGEWPGDEAVNAEVEAQCIPAFEAFVGKLWDESILNMYPITPTQATWDQMNDRVVQCVIFDQDAAGNAIEVTGTLKGAAR